MITRVSIGGISLAVDSSTVDKETKTNFPGLRIGPEYEQFVAQAPDPISIVLTLTNSPSFEEKIYKHTFDSSALWVLHHNDRNDFRVEHKKSFDGEVLAFMDVNLNERTGTILYTEEGLRDPAAGFLPFVHPLDGVLFINLLPSCKGMLLHACGIDDRGMGYLFPGGSGSGKSTTARLWADRPGVKILNDERIIVREIEGVLCACGTPWHGEVNRCDPGKRELRKVFFLKHAGENYAKRLSRVDAASRMFVSCLPTFWDRDGMQETLSLIDSIVRRVPCYELGFEPDGSSIDFVRALT